jgi:hypothetical protein
LPFKLLAGFPGILWDELDEPQPCMVFIEMNLEAARIGSDVTLPSGGLLRSFANSKSTG